MGRDFRDVVSAIRANYDSLNWWRNRVFVPYVVGTMTRLYPGYPGYKKAINVPDADWDNLIVLDGCRADAFERVADLDRFDDYQSVVSLGSHSSEWTRRNFGGREFGDIVYVSANPHTSKIAGDSFHSIVEMWNREFDETAGTVHPEDMAVAARDTHQRYPNKRLVVHFMQPHGPFIGSDIPETEQDDRYWEAYDQNLAHVLGVVRDLLGDLSGRTVVTADHGQIGPHPVLDILGLSGHKPGLRNPGLVVVPWATVDGDRREIVDGRATAVETDGVQQRLHDLGYRT